MVNRFVARNFFATSLLLLAGVGQAAHAASGGNIQLSAAKFTVAQNAGSLKITINRTGGSTGSVQAHYGTHYDTAKGGVDYGAYAGYVSWNSGDTSSRTVSVQILNGTPYSGTRHLTFTVDSANGADLGSPAGADITITGSAGSTEATPVASSGRVSAPSSITVTGQTAGSVSLSWSAPSSGNSVSHYKIYRNGGSYATTTATNYTDYGATDVTNGSYNSASTVYNYAVSAVDSQGNEGAKTTQTTFNVYYNGAYNWLGDFSYGGTSVNYSDSSGGPESGGHDIAIYASGAYGGFQPFAGKTVTQWDLETGAFNYISIDLKPTLNNQTWRISMISRLPPGDVYPWADANIEDYGPAPVPGRWATYKIPLSDLSMGKTNFQGSISGNTLTVTSVSSGVGVDAGGFVTGNGVKAGTYITGHHANGGPGKYTISPSQYVSNTSMVEQRTGLYKFDIVDGTGAYNNRYYIDNVRFTSQ